MKKFIVCFLTTVLMLGAFAACNASADTNSAGTSPAASESPALSEPESQPESADEGASEAEPGATGETHGNYSDEMKIQHSTDISPEDGADSVERDGDHADSPYFSRLDFYNMESTDTLTILPKFKTLQQTSEWSCGVTSALMVMEYYGKLGDYDEHSLSLLRPQQDEPGGTSLKEAVAIFDAVGGFSLTTTLDLADEFNLDSIQAFLAEGTPVMVCWNDWGGHWQVIIGYDTMGTEATGDDVLIVADPYDTTDHNQDGYGIYGAERFIYNFTTYNFFTEEDGNDKLFIAAKPAE